MILQDIEQIIIDIKNYGFESFFNYGLAEGYTTRDEIGKYVDYLLSMLSSKDLFEDCLYVKNEYEKYRDKYGL